jgi:hypothetical protein
MTKLRAVGLLAVLVVAGCARPTVGGGGAPAGLPSPSPADTLVLRVAYTGGFTAPTELATRIPVVSVYADGRVVTAGPRIEIYPARTLPNLLVQHIARADIDKLIQRALAAGVGSATDFGEPSIADAASTSFTVLTDAGVKTAEVYALSETDGATGGVNQTQRAARAKLAKLFADLTDLPKTLGAGKIDEAKPFTYVGLAAVSFPWEASGEPANDNQAELAWPGPALPGKTTGSLDLGCVTATGDALNKVLDAAKNANIATPWTSGGKRWTVAVRPLLPDESDCDDLPAR